MAAGGKGGWTIRAGKGFAGFDVNDCAVDDVLDFFDAAICPGVNASGNGKCFISKFCTRGRSRNGQRWRLVG